MKYIFNYANQIHELTEQDVESKEFCSQSEMINYIFDRLTFDNDVIYTISLEFNNQYEEFPSAFICRGAKEFTNYINNSFFKIVPECYVFIFEWENYEDALNYLKDTFQTSSKMY